MNTFIFLQKISINLRKLVISILGKLGFKVEFHDLLPIRALNTISTIFKGRSSMEKRFIAYYGKHRSGAHGQFFQDLFVLFILESLRGAPQGVRARDGYFVDIGATDGVGISNTYLLEKQYGWRGIVAEPARRWQAELKRNRTCVVENRCVWSESKVKLSFMETENAGQSGLACVNEKDAFSGERESNIKYEVETVSLLDMLVAHSAPKSIDFLSLDTEGAEYTILKDFDFDRYLFKVIAVEHNFNKRHCADLNQLLTSKGYVKVCRAVSWVDYWYVHSSVYAQLAI